MNKETQEAIKNIVDSVGNGISFAEAKELIELILKYQSFKVNKEITR